MVRRGFVDMGVDTYKVRGARRLRTLVLDHHWQAGALCSDGCLSLTSLGPQHWPRADIVPYGYIKAEGRCLGLKQQNERGRLLQNNQYHSVRVPCGLNKLKTRQNKDILTVTAHTVVSLEENGPIVGYGQARFFGHGG